MRKQVQLTDEEKELVKLNERRFNITLKDAYFHNGVRVWEWEANDECELSKMLDEIYGKEEHTGKKKHHNR